uniref:Beta-catenin-like protein 1 n=1 Tax=Panstrongylus megistus TaxID=65343 RepID=A0A069DVH7_9HEMI
MDVGELLSFKPLSTPKRYQPGDLDEEEEDYDKHKKMKKIHKMKASEIERLEREKKEKQEEEARAKKEEEQDMIQKLVESSEPKENDILDETTLKRMLLLFEKRALRNQEMRIKFPESPDKFMESELELHEAIQELHAIATVPDLYPLMVQLNAIPSLLELLSHENTDISVAVVDLLQELTDVDILNESTEGAEALVEALLNQQVISLLLHNLQRMDENVKEEADGVHNTLAIIENLVELKPHLVSEIGKQGLLQWLLKRLKSKLPAEQNKLYATEILSILLQNNVENKTLLGELGGIDILLQQLAQYKRHDPATAEECEIMENLFDALCCSLMVSTNKELFLKGEGLQLMNLMLREKKLSRNGSLKVVNYALIGPDGKDNCNKFVDILGLRTIFPLFMKTPKKNRKKMLTAEEHEEHVISIIASMLRNCRGTQRSRLLSKFSENDHEKVDRLLELHFKYMEKVDSVDAELERKNAAEKEMDEDEIYLKRLDSGLFTLQLIDYIMLEICAGSPPSVKQRVTLILNQRGASLKTIRHIMREYAGNLGDDGDAEWKELEQQHILQLVDKF